MAGIVLRGREFKKGDLLSPGQAYELAVELAAKGLGFVSPNPPVGCVILSKTDQLLGWGYHKKFGSPHAEVNAIDSIDDKSQLKGATVVVSLEPCSFFGKTPPCTQLLTQFPIGRVEYGQLDPNPRVSGKGIDLLKEKKIEVERWSINPADPSFKKLRKLTAPFFTNQVHQRSFVSLKTATSLDGQMALKSGESQWITDEEARSYSHLLRAQHDAVLVGANTILQDNPKLNIRHEKFPEHLNKVIVLDPQAILMDKWSNLEIMQYRPPENILWVTANDSSHLDVPVSIHQGEVNSEDFSLDRLLEQFYQQFQIGSVYIEGGPFTHSKFVQSGLVDQYYLFFGHKLLGSDQNRGWTFGLGVDKMSQARELAHSETVFFENSHLLVFDGPHQK